MKKLLSLLAAAFAALSLTGCSVPDDISFIQDIVNIHDEYTEETQSAVSTEDSQSNAPAADESAQPEISDTAEPAPVTDEHSEQQPNAPPEDTQENALAEDGSYDSPEDVALYIHTYGRLPSNFITKKQARDLGWEGGSVEKYAEGKCIGGDRFGNYEGLLPEKAGRSYTECDVNTLGASSRGAERIIFSPDGLIYYTGDHYAHFTLLYGEE